MTREEAKKMWPIIKAFGDGEEIEFRSGVCDDWFNFGGTNKLSFDGHPECYRIKPEPKYRPFTSTEECWQEMQKHQPFGWIKTEDDRRVIAYMDVDGILTGNDAFCTFEYAIKHYTFDDGTPFGVKEEEV